MSSKTELSPRASRSVRHRILEAAQRIIVDLGALRLTFDFLAESAAISKSGLLYHFSSKGSLLRALVERYLLGTEQCVKQASEQLGNVHDAGRLKARIIGLLGDNSRSNVSFAPLLGAFGNDPELLKPIRDSNEVDSGYLAKATANFARASIVILAIDGLMLRESLAISAFTEQQRDDIVKELTKLAEACVAIGD